MRISRQQAGAVILDTRPAAQFAAGPIPGAVHKPLDHLPASIEDLDPDRRAVVYCKGGYRSIIECSILQRAGFLREVRWQGAAGR
jgi:rhodanese-related sulfurtransferase